MKAVELQLCSHTQLQCLMIQHQPKINLGESAHKSDATIVASSFPTLSLWWQQSSHVTPNWPRID